MTARPCVDPANNPVSSARYLGACAADMPVEVAAVLRRCNPLPSPLPRIPAGEFAVRHGAAPEDVARLRAFARQHGLRETTCEPASRTIHWRASAGLMQKAFQIQLGHYEVVRGGPAFLGCPTEPVLPDPALIAVLGLDQRPVARPHFRLARTEPAARYTPLDVGMLYRFPDGDGSGQTIGIIELGGGYRQSDLDAYFSRLGIQTPSIRAVAVDDVQNRPGSAADTEVTLDIEIAAALAPAATFLVYFAPNTPRGFHDAIAQALHGSLPAANILSISWGGPENQWSKSAREAVETILQDAASLGVTVCVASGDSGSSDGEGNDQVHVDFPASSPWTLGCGGTRLLARGDAIQSEVAWNDMAAGGGATGGGVSTSAARPSWQDDAGVPTLGNGFAGRGVPDVAGNADPLTGYEVLVDGRLAMVGGTSAVAPLWAALAARLNQRLGHPLGFANPPLYRSAPGTFHDITRGSNGAYAANPGWDACTGLGSPDGRRLLESVTEDRTSPR